MEQMTTDYLGWAMESKTLERELIYLSVSHSSPSVMPTGS